MDLLLLSVLLNSQSANFFNYPCFYFRGLGAKALFWPKKESAEERVGEVWMGSWGWDRMGWRQDQEGGGREVKGEKIPQ